MQNLLLQNLHRSVPYLSYPPLGSWEMEKGPEGKKDSVAIGIVAVGKLVE